MERIPEPELMDDEAQAKAYAEAEFTEPHDAFVSLFRQKFPGQQITGTVLDLGCGPADISRRFARAYPQVTIHAVDGAAAMLHHGERLNQQAGLSPRIQLVEARLPGIVLPQKSYHTIISNSLLHHLHDPFVLWQTIKQYGYPGSKVFIMDLLRCRDTQQAKALVEQYAGNEPAVLQQDFYHSLCAAFTPAEVQQQLDDSGLRGLMIEVTSDRHMIIFGTL